MDEKSRVAARRRQSIRERAKIVAAVLFGLVCGISCLSIDLGSHTVESPLAGTLKQEGSLNDVTFSSRIATVYYPRPYVSPPNLELTSSQSIFPALDSFEVIEQKADHFTVRRRSEGFFNSIVYKWKAEGIPVGLPVLEPTKTPPQPVNELSKEATLPPAPLTPADAINVEPGGK